MEQLYRTIIENLHDGVYFVDMERKITFWNRAAEEITGYKAEEIIGKDCPSSYLHHIDEDGNPLCIVGCPLFSTLLDGEQRKERVFVRHKEGYRVPVLVNIIPVYEEGEIIGAVEIFTRDTPTVYEDHLVEHLEGIALHDDLTQVPNRRYLENFLQHKFDEYHKFHKSFAVIFGDIDDFSHFNNEYGHDVGDEVLVSIGKAILHNTKVNDLVGRWGGEEFLGIHVASSEDEIRKMAEQYCHLIAGSEVLHKERTLSVTVSMGATMVRPGDNAETIIERADRLMYQSKKDGKNKVTVG